MVDVALEETELLRLVTLDRGAEEDLLPLDEWTEVGSVLVPLRVAVGLVVDVAFALKLPVAVDVAFFELDGQIDDDDECFPLPELVVGTAEEEVPLVGEEEEVAFHEPLLLLGDHDNDDDEAV